LETKGEIEKLIKIREKALNKINLEEESDQIQKLIRKRDEIY
jgi:hypothetical protein